MTSVLTVVAFARSLNSLSSMSGAPCRLTARAAMQSLLRHAHTETRRVRALGAGSERPPPHTETRRVRALGAGSERPPPSRGQHTRGEHRGTTFSCNEDRGEMRGGLGSRDQRMEGSAMTAKTVVHLELPAKDGGRARKFYSTLLGWKFKDAGMPDM